MYTRLEVFPADSDTRQSMIVIEVSEMITCMVIMTGVLRLYVRACTSVSFAHGALYHEARS